MVKDPDTLAIYIHWPYCARICPYCDFNVYKARRDEGLVSAIIKDLSYWRKWSGPRKITSVHFGGGTPSLMRSGDVETIIKTIRDLWTIASNFEIAIEANPSDAKEDHWKGLKAAGVNRLSLGVQTFHDDGLKLLGRDHSADQAEAALALATTLFTSVSLDLIFGWAGQSEAQWRQDLQTALESRVSHISAYQLTIEPGTAFAKAEDRGQTRASSEMQSADFYDMTKQTLIGAGYEHYEVSNFARPDARSRHNLTCWQGGDYIGVGPGAHGRLTQNSTRIATIAAMRPEIYQAKVVNTGTGIDELETLSATDWADEYVLMGLRIAEGISLERFHEISGNRLPEERLAPLMKDGYVAIENSRLSATDKGRLVLNHITDMLLAG